MPAPDTAMHQPTARETATAESDPSPGQAPGPASRARDGRSQRAMALLRLMWPMTLVVPLLLLVATTGFNLMAAGNALIRNEGRWSKAQKDAVQFLDLYSHTCERLYFTRYQAAIAVPLGYGEGRRQLLKESPDMDAARAALRRAGSMPDDNGYQLLRLGMSGYVPLLARVNQLWGEADQLIENLDGLAQQLHQGISTAGCPDPQARQMVMNQVYWVNERLTPIQTEYSEIVGIVNRRLHLALLSFTLGSGALLLLLGTALSRRVVRADEGADRAIQAELAARRQAIATLRETMQALAGANGPVAGGPAVQPVDDDIEAITQQMQALVARQRSDHEALTTIFALSPDAFVSFDGQGRVSHVSPAFQALVGLPAAAVQGQDEAGFLRLLNGRCRPEAALPALQAAQGAEPGQPWRLMLAGAPPRTLEASLHQAEGGSARAVLCLRDVTQALAVDRLKGEFMTTAAHELRTPMASIFGFVELMRLRSMTDDRRAELLAIVHRQSRQMMGILDDLLDLARLESRGGGELAREPLDLAALAGDVVAAFGHPPGREAPRLQLRGPAAAVLADRDKLVRVLNNLLSNAYKYSPAGGEVSVGLVEGHGPDGQPRIGLRVQDRGLGMTPEQLQRMGERFYRADASGNIPGTGLGISIVREILQLHGGSLQVDSEAGRGTCCTAWLPLLSQAARPTAPAEALV